MEEVIRLNRLCIHVIGEMCQSGVGAIGPGDGNGAIDGYGG